MKPTLKEIVYIFKRTQPLIVLGVLAVFHATLLGGDYTAAIERIFDFAYQDTNVIIVDMIRNFLANIAILAWIHYCLFHVIRKISFYKTIFIKHKRPDSSEIKWWSSRILNAELVIWYTILAGYFIDIIKLHNKTISEFIVVVLGENISRLTIAFVVLVVTVVFFICINIAENKSFKK